MMSNITTMAVVVDAKNEQARAFSEYHGFTVFPGQPKRLYLPMAMIARQFS